MKKLFIIRHAKSDHGWQYQTDFERPLNQRGRSDALRMAGELRKVVNVLDQILVSTARRTKETAQYFMEALEQDPSTVTYVASLYLPSEEDLWKAMSEVDRDCENLAVITHNPAAEQLFHRYHPGEKLPTCSIIELHYDGDDWSKISPGNARFISHKFPKLYG